MPCPRRSETCRLQPTQAGTSLASQLPLAFCVIQHREDVKLSRETQQIKNQATSLREGVAMLLSFPEKIRVGKKLEEARPVEDDWPNSKMIR